MITTKKIDLQEGSWTEIVPPSDLHQILSARVTEHKLDEGINSVIKLHSHFKSARPLERALNLLGYDKETVDIVSAPIESSTEEWTITKLQFVSDYIIKPYSGYYSYRHCPKTVSLNLPAWKFSNKSGKCFYVADKKDIPTDFTKRLVNNNLAIFPSGTHVLQKAVETMKRFVESV